LLRHLAPAAHGTVDICLLGQKRWHKGDSQACVGFDTRHKCWNFDAVRQWALEHQALDQLPHEFCKPSRSLDDVLRQCLELGERRGVLGLDPILLMLLSFLQVPVKWLYKIVDRMY